MVRGYWFLLLDWELLRLSEDPLYTTMYSTAWRTLMRHIFPHSVWVACSYSLIPDTHISSPSHRPSTSRYSASYVCPLVEHTPHWVPCRWLAGDSQVIPIPYFIRSSFLRTYSLILRLISILCLSLFSDQIVSLNGINVNSLFELIKEKWKAGSQDSRLVPPTTDFVSVLFCFFSV